ncbi:lipopolysaccharide biosynthesis protein [Clostridium intestinale]|uniref:Oligosaccharide flippase family protein n=1 Tax=Clostridium intestinale TaxID=36845 RepID=A0A7D6ZFQ4_9CLOT|nr:oligosaccharide flippase family protein [Clostridium intestinale]QLY79121.1 oligosaccharide flippase family protein [Clostridium intestinale]
MKSSKIYTLGTITSSISIVVSILANIAIVPILLNNLGKEQYGIWLTLSSIFGAMNIADLGIGQSVSKLISQNSDTEDREEYITSIISTAFFTSVMISIVILLINIVISFFAEKILNLDGYNIQNLYIILCVNFLINFVFSIFNNILIGYKRIYLSNILIIIRSILMLVSNYAFFKYSNDIKKLAIVYTVTSVIVFVISIIFIKKRSKGTIISIKAYDKKLLKVILKPGIFFFLIQVSGIIVYNTDNIILTNFIGAEIVALYFSAYKIIDIFMKLIFVVSDNIFPFISALHGKKDIGQIRTLNIITSKVSIIMCVFLSIMYYFFSSEIIDIWLGKGNFIGYDIILVLCLILVINANTHNAGVYINALYKHKKTAYLAVIEAILNLILSLILVNRIGVLGVVLGTLIASLLTSAWFTPYYCCKILGINFKRYFIDVILKNIILAFLFTMLIFIQKQFINIDVFWKLISCFAFNFIIFLILSYGIAFNKIEKSKLKEMYNKVIKPKFRRV